MHFVPMEGGERGGRRWENNYIYRFGLFYYFSLSLTLFSTADSIMALKEGIEDDPLY